MACKGRGSRSCRLRGREQHQRRWDGGRFWRRGQGRQQRTTTTTMTATSTMVSDGRSHSPGRQKAGRDSLHAARRPRRRHKRAGSRDPLPNDGRRDTRTGTSGALRVGLPAPVSVKSWTPESAVKSTPCCLYHVHLGHHRGPLLITSTRQVSWSPGQLGPGLASLGKRWPTTLNPNPSLDTV